MMEEFGNLHKQNKEEKGRKEGRGSVNSVIICLIHE
jgi:hypothetical protein